MILFIIESKNLFRCNRHSYNVSVILDLNTWSSEKHAFVFKITKKSDFYLIVKIIDWFFVIISTQYYLFIILLKYLNSVLRNRYFKVFMFVKMDFFHKFYVENCESNTFIYFRIIVVSEFCLIVLFSYTINGVVARIYIYETQVEKNYFSKWVQLIAIVLLLGNIKLLDWLQFWTKKSLWYAHLCIDFIKSAVLCIYFQRNFD